MKRHLHSRVTNHLFIYSGTAILLLLLSMIALWWQWNANPIIHVPIPVMPHPNAFNYYLEAANAVPIDLPDHEAYVSLTMTERHELLAARDYVTTIFQQGTQFQYLSPPARSYYPSQFYGKFRNLAKYFSYLAWRDACAGKWGKAMETALDGDRLGVDIHRGSDDFGILVGWACQWIARQDAWDIISHLSPEEAKNALRELEVINTHEIPYSDTCRENKWRDQAVLMSLFQTRGWQAWLANQSYLSLESREKEIERLKLTNKRIAMDLLTRYNDQCITIASQPFSNHTPEPPLPDNDIVKLLIDSSLFNKIRTKELSNVAGNRLLSITLALHVYHSEHKSYPASLSILVSNGYLKSMSIDPFTTNEVFHYRVRGDVFTLYSVGPDCKDDGGRPIMDNFHPHQVAIIINNDDKGDIVVGKNTI